METGILTDAHYMLRSIDKAISGLSTNPPLYGDQVGAVLVSSHGDVISQAHNMIYGGVRRHAEEIVLAEAKGTDISYATLYVTIEPCNGNPHHERRHCCEQIADFGIRRVVMGESKRRYEGGADYMREQGVQVEIIENEWISQLSNLLISGIATREGQSHERILRKIERIRLDVNL